MAIDPGALANAGSSRRKDVWCRSNTHWSFVSPWDGKRGGADMPGRVKMKCRGVKEESMTEREWMS